MHTFSLTPDTNPAALESTLARLLVPGNIMDSSLKVYCNRLQERYRILSVTSPAPQWHKNLLITTEIRCQCEIYLPLAEIQAAFRQLFLLSCRYKPFLPAVPVFSALSWVDALERIDSSVFRLNPALVIADVAQNQSRRFKFLAAMFIPKRYGGGFERYPLQQAFLKDWLSCFKDERIALLDAACGSGEGVYALAQMVEQSGFEPDAATIHGCTVEPLELAAAAHGWFPNDHGREASVKGIVEQLRSRESVRFFKEDICAGDKGLALYDVVICNGLLGGPLLHEINALEMAVKGLAQRVKKGGILLAADRFHSGWRKIIPLAVIQMLLVRNGIRIIDLPEGIGGIRTE